MKMSVSKTQDILTSLVMQTFAFRNGVVPPTFGSNTLQTRACKLLGILGEPNRKLEKNKMKMDARSNAIIDTIKELFTSVKEIEKLKMEMIEW